MHLLFYSDQNLFPPFFRVLKYAGENDLFLSNCLTKSRTASQNFSYISKSPDEDSYRAE
jgi:hypothetical protein